MRSPKLILPILVSGILNFVSLTPLSATEIENWIFNPTTGHYYALTQRADWNAAESEAVLNGGHLATVNDSAENQWIVQTFTQPGTETNSWIGLADKDVEGTFEWANDESVGYTNWSSGEPNDQGDEDYVYMFMQDNANSVTPGLWNDVNFATGAGGGLLGIVERNTSPTECWILNPANGHYYRLTERGDWNEAEAEAQLYGGHLVTINDAAENQWVVEAFTQPGTETNSWIGLTDKNVEGSFEWANGESVGYTNWNSGEPNDQGDEDYVYMFMQDNLNSVTPGLWNDVNFVTGAGGGLLGIVERDTPPGDVAGIWDLVTANAAWPTRWGFGFVVFNDKFWILGGVSGNTHYNDVWSSSDGANWTQDVVSAPWGPRRTHTTLVFQTKIWVLGGYDGGSSYNDVWSSTDGVNWIQETASAGWGARNYHASVVFDDKMWVLGGSGDTNDVWSSPDGVSWTQVTASAPWLGRHSHAAIAHAGQIWVLGGGQANAGGDFSDVWASPDGLNWTEVNPSAPWPGHFKNAVVALNNRIWVLGGTDVNGMTDQIWSSTDGQLWTQTTVIGSQWTPRANHNAVVMDGRIWLAGGHLISGQVLNDIWSSADSTCSCAYKDIFASEWSAIASALALETDVANATGKEIPERWGLAMIIAALCDVDASCHDLTYDTLYTNLTVLDAEAPAVVAAVAPFRHVLAALMFVDLDQQIYFAGLLGLTGTYEVASTGARGSSEIYSDTGDVDGDGALNNEEYQNTLSWNGTSAEFGAAAIDPSSKGFPPTPIHTFPILLVVTAFVFGLGAKILKRRQT